MSSQEVAAFGAPSLVTRATNDVAQIQNLAVLVFTMLVAAPAIFLGGIALASTRTSRCPASWWRSFPCSPSS